VAHLNFIRPMRNKVLVFFANAPPSVREMLNRSLASGDYDGRWAANDREALELSQNQRLDLLLLDFNRPLKRALNTLGQLQAVNAFVPVILITEQKTEFERAVAGHVAALISKPFEVSLLLRTMREALHPLSETAAVDQHAPAKSRTDD
jgi:two-component system response regulator (stage 0 sporulation protein F)